MRRLRARAAGIYPAEAATELLVATIWPSRSDFRDRFICAGTRFTDGTTPMAVTAGLLRSPPSAGQMSRSGAERRLLSLGDGIL